MIDADLFETMWKMRSMRRLKPDPIAPELHARFSIPDDFGVVAMIPIGYPLGKFAAVRRQPLESCTLQGLSKTPRRICSVALAARLVMTACRAHALLLDLLFRAPAHRCDTA